MQSLMLLVMIMVCSTICAGPQEELFLKATQAYKAHDYNQAFKMYQEIEPKNTAVYYNMGNSSYKCNNFVDAYLFWKKAERTASGQLYKNIQQNLMTCLSELNKSELSQGLASISARVNGVLAGIPSGIAQVVFLLLWYILWFGKRMLINRRRIIIFFVCGSMLISGGIVVAKFYKAQIQYGLIRKEQMQLFAGPNERYQVLGNLNQLDVVKIKLMDGSWCKVAHQNQIGWTPIEAIEIL